MYRKNLYSLLFLFILLILILPSVQSKFNFIKSNGLTGAFEKLSKPAFSRSSWFSGDFQEKYTKYREEEIGFRPDFIRIYNQAEFSLFKRSHGKTVIGKDDYLFEQEYIDSWVGSNFAGDKYCEERVSLMKKLQDRLLNEFNVHLIVIFTPDKGHFYPEKIPGRIAKLKKLQTNYSFYAQKCVKAGINLIDFNKWFLQIRDTSRYPLYPKTGIHWSCYGAMLTADSLAEYLRIKFGASTPRMVVDSLEISSRARAEDDDLGHLMNLIREIPHPAYAYPAVSYNKDPGGEKPSALFIGDSFYWNWYNPGYIEGIFNNKEFWYYDKSVYPETFSKQLNTNQLDIREVLKRQNFVILIQTNAAYGNPGYGFLDRVFTELDPASERLLTYERKIRNSEEWMAVIVEKAKTRNISVDEMIRIDAQYMLDQEQKENHGN